MHMYIRAIKMYFGGISGPDPSEIIENETLYAEFHGEFDFQGPGIDLKGQKHQKHENTEY